MCTLLSAFYNRTFDFFFPPSFPSGNLRSVGNKIRPLKNSSRIQTSNTLKYTECPSKFWPIFQSSVRLTIEPEVHRKLSRKLALMIIDTFQTTSGELPD